MKKVFKFKKDQSWDGDEEMFEFIESAITNYGEVGEYPKVKSNLKVTIIIDKEKNND